MTLKKRLKLATASLALAASLGSAASAATVPALDPGDAQHYAAAFAACDRGDFIDAQMQTAAIRDKSLLGYVSFSELTRAGAQATFDDLAGWLAKFRELPPANRVFKLAAKRNPAGTAALPPPAVRVAAAPQEAVRATLVSERDRRARDAYYAGEVHRAKTLAVDAGDRWIAGLAAYRLKAYGESRAWFSELAQDRSQGASVRSAAAFWSARAASALGDAAQANAALQLAAQNAETFYGMVAARELELARAAVAGEPIGAPMIQAGLTPVSADLAAFITGDDRAHRAAALAQLGRLQQAGEELRAGLFLASTPEQKARWSTLAAMLGASLSGSPSADDYPAPLLAPRSGFTIDRALVYAIVRQESRFNPMAVSPVGAVGLMQLMPAAAASAAGNDRLMADMSPLFDPALNLRVGQDYLTWLMERGVGYDLMRVVAAYNGGPGMVQRTVDLLGGDPDPLLLMESLPSLETRTYVQKVMAGYWTYKKMFGEETKTLDALAGGAQLIDARLDLGQPMGAPTQLSGQPLDPALR